LVQIVFGFLKAAFIDFLTTATN